MTDEPKLIRLIRAGEAERAFHMLVGGTGKFTDKAADGETAYDLVQRIGGERMKELFRTHLICG